MRPIAFYLPQFHPIPENDEAYGKGFTEWTNTRKAVPLFEGHRQPRTPYGEDYYCLLDKDVMVRQATLAKEYGVYGFCYYHYWFSGGHKLLEKPVEMMLKSPEIDIPFCLCWANENWTKRWDGGNKDVIVAQDYGDMDDLDRHIDYLCDFFRDPRYIRIDDKPLLLIYKADIIPNLKKILDRIRSRVVANGFKGIVLASQYPKYFFEDVHLNYFDHYVQFQPRFAQELEERAGHSALYNTAMKLMISLGLREFGKKLRAKALGTDSFGENAELVHRSYSEDWERILSYEVRDKRLIAGAFVDWDNTPRNKKGLVYDGTSPELFGEYMKRLSDKIDREYSSDFVFINAWNEWAEGAYLEPDTVYGYEYLEKLKGSIRDK